MQPSYLPLPHKEIILWTYKQQRVLHTSDSSAAIHFFPQHQNPEWTQLLFSASKQTTNFSQSWKIGCMQRKVWRVSHDELMISQSQRQIKLMDPTPSGLRVQHTKKKKTRKTSMQTFPILSVSSTLGRSVHNKKLLQFSLNESGFHINFNFIKFNLLLTVWLTQKK